MDIDIFALYIIYILYLSTISTYKLSLILHLIIWGLIQGSYLTKWALINFFFFLKKI